MEEHEVVYAKDQPPYLPLPTLPTFDGKVLCRWELSDVDRASVWDGSDVYLTVQTGGDPLQPVKIEVGNKHDGPPSLSACEFSRQSRLAKVADALDWIVSETQTGGSEFGLPRVATKAAEAAKLVREELKAVCKK
jgi:hypothetical protein